MDFSRIQQILHPSFYANYFREKGIYMGKKVRFCLKKQIVYFTSSIRFKERPQFYKSLILFMFLILLAALLGLKFN